MSFITKRHIPRRTFLKGTGVTLALPLLDAMVPASTALAQTVAGQTEEPVRRHFLPARDGTRPLGAGGRGRTARQDALYPRVARRAEGRDRRAEWSLVAVGGAARGHNGFRSLGGRRIPHAIKPRKTAGSDATVGSATIDQLIAQKIGQETLLPSLQLACEDPNSSSSNCGEGYSCSYTNSISWVELPTPENETVPRTSPLPMELNPQVVFERLFGSGATPEVRAQRMKQSQSILDSLVKELGGSAQAARRGDVRTVNQYTDEIREIERRIQLAAKSINDVPGSRSAAGNPGAVRRAHPPALGHGRHAFKADITRVATLLGARDLTGRAYPFPKSELFPDGGTSVSFHGGSHHQDDPVQMRRYAALNRYHVSTMAYLAEEAEVDPGRRRQPARPLADSVWHQHGQLEPAPALRRARTCWSAAPTASSRATAISTTTARPSRPATCC